MPDSVRKRLANRGQILRTLQFAAPLRRTELSRRTGIRPSSVSSIVQQLINEKLVRPALPCQPKSRLELDPTYYHVLALAITASSITAARVFLDGRLADRLERPLPSAGSAPRILAAAAELVAELRQRQPAGIAGIGVSLPGVVDPAAGCCRYSVLFGNERDVPVAKLLADQLGIAASQLEIDNDARCQLWAAAWFERLLLANRDMLYVGVHDGIGCAMIVAGQRVLGHQLAAGEIGHLRAGSEGRLCGCGRTDCLETYCSTGAIQNELARIRPDLQAMPPAQLAAAASRDQAVLAVLDRQARRLAEMLAGLVAAVDPGVLLLGAVNLELAELLGGLLKRHLYSELMGLQAGATAEIRPVAMPDATLRGAAGLVLERNFAPQDTCSPT